MAREWVCAPIHLQSSIELLQVLVGAITAYPFDLLLHFPPIWGLNEFAGLA